MSKPSNIRRPGAGRSAKAKSSNTSGLLGAMKTGERGKWVSKITVRGVRYYLGYFYSPEDAHDAYVRAAKKYGVTLPV